MVIKFKKANDSQLYQIEGSNLTLLKVAIIIYLGTESAFHIFQKTIDNDLLRYYPQESDRNNLVKRNYNNYRAEYSSEISECIKTIKPIE